MNEIKSELFFDKSQPFNWNLYPADANLQKDQVFLVYGDSKLLQNQRLLEWVTADELEFFKRMDAVVGDTWLSTRAVLRFLCSYFTSMPLNEIVFTKTSMGKPYLTSGLLHFNVSHSGSVFLIGLSRNLELGVDVEVMTDLPVREMAEYALSASELAFCKNGDDRERFYKIWTLKEAYLKAVGSGLTDNLSETDVMDSDALFYENGWRPVTFTTPGGEMGALVAPVSVTDVVGFSLPVDFPF